MKKLFRDRFGQGLPRTEELDAESRDALWGILSARIAEEWFGLERYNIVSLKSIQGWSRA